MQTTLQTMIESHRRNEPYHGSIYCEWQKQNPNGTRQQYRKWLMRDNKKCVVCGDKAVLVDLKRDKGGNELQFRPGVFVPKWNNLISLCKVHEKV